MIAAAVLLLMAGSANADCARLLEMAGRPGVDERLRRQCAFFVDAGERSYADRLDELTRALCVASERRGVPSAQSVWGNSVAILTGDLLFARASKLIAAMGSGSVIGQAETFGKVWLPGASMLIIYVVMALILLFRPQGLFGRALK